MCFEPVGTEATVGNEGHIEGVSVLHLLDDDAFNDLFLLRINGEVEFVVHLQDHLAPDALFPEAVEDTDHGHLDDVGSSALDRGIDGVTLGKATHGGVLRDQRW